MSAWLCSRCGANTHIDILANNNDMCSNCASSYVEEDSTNNAREDIVNKPKHYNFATIEPIDVIEDWQLDFRLANALKYISRAGKKDPAKTKEDLQKAIWYINRYILKECSDGNK
jgi:DNA-dependent RNA polymerase auxiliary subunit epsilon